MRRALLGRAAERFGKNLTHRIEETLSKWKDKFLPYKDLKRRLKLISVAELSGKRFKVADEDLVNDHAPFSATMEEFVGLLEAELDKSNTCRLTSFRGNTVRNSLWPLSPLFQWLTGAIMFQT